MKFKTLLGSAALTFAIPASLSAAPQGQPGEQLFAARCKSCHSVAPNSPGLLGPNLRGVVGRKAATAEFKAYSTALKSSKVTWTRDALDSFLAAPRRAVPGTRMAVTVSDSQQRAAIIDYLAAQR